ncbi:hypothetical protein M758_10G127200 [Ceratodon purpureus]|uniref:Uncharacterized protein n=1 Tax=Ceratodon purpureus TaxID=3225 RepID=A0A8T0GLI5_CERPU|nr:hypothetical protein KC19_10G132500 [Ceratodon purpureus]KAG0559831.1 hypothetical protein KC19_10G132500 [Ceratodon purpureus]KAG0559832.1 hypothetical protein KC19_10G132500 [Ceratodon purpureus]KAG0603872.1 hypothetical protein M758_10G127200 [Ceratodon purpureus]KAG0603873.1 hypothetical protein M758_10G127200 [Ceratodon purpureus]
MAFILRGLEAGACLSAIAFLLGLAAVTWLPDELHMWQSFPIPRMLAILIIPVIAFAFSLFLSLITSCDPRLASQSTTSGAAIAAVIALPCLFAVPLEILIVYAGSTGHLGTAPFVILACLLDFALCAIFKYVEPNYVVGIRCLWTLRNDHVWADTHFFASCIFLVTGVVGLVLVFFVPPGLWQLLVIAGLFFAPTAISVLYSYIIREEAQYIVR